MNRKGIFWVLRIFVMWLLLFMLFEFLIGFYVVNLLFVFVVLSLFDVGMVRVVLGLVKRV